MLRVIFRHSRPAFRSQTPKFVNFKRSFADPKETSDPLKSAFQQDEVVPPPKNTRTTPPLSFDPSDPISLLSHLKQKRGDDPNAAFKREQMSEIARSENTKREVDEEELAMEDRLSPEEAEAVREKMLSDAYDQLMDDDEIDIDESEFNDLDSQAPDYAERRLQRVLKKAEEARQKKEKRLARRKQQLSKDKEAERIFREKFLHEGDERMLDPRARKLARPSKAGMFSLEGDQKQPRPEDFKSPKIRAIVEERLKSERQTMLEMHKTVTSQGRQRRKDFSVGEHLAEGFELLAQKQELRQERLRTESHFQLIGYITQIEDAQSKRLRNERKAQYRLDKWKAKIQEKYKEKNTARRERRLAARKLKAEEVRTNPDWFFYQELKYWIHKKHLTNLQVRSTIQALLKNPSYTDQQKRDALDYMIKVLDGAENQPKEWYENKWQYYKGLATENPQHISPDYVKDPDFKVPQSYDELIESVEAEMTYEERAARFAPSAYKPKYSFLEY